MEIVHVFHNYYPALGGMERAVKYLAEEQAKLGHKVTVITSKIGADNRPKEEILGGVKIVRVKSFRFLYNDLTIPLEDPDIGKADIIHAHSQNSLFSLMMARRLKKKIGGKMVFYFMAVDAFRDHPNIAIRLLGPSYGVWSVKRALEISDLALVKSRRDKKALKSKYGVEAIYIPDGIPDYYFTIERNPYKFREKFGIKQDKIFLYIGRLHKLKGPHVLVKALRYIDDRNLAAVFIGPDDGYKKHIISLAKRLGVEDRVYLLEYLSEEDKIHAIDASTAVIVPSLCDYVEAYSLVISEAWARGKPVIASSIGELPYRVRDGENGLLVRPGNEKMLAEAMTKLLDDSRLAQRMGEKGKKEVVTWKNIAMKTIDLYHKLIS